MISNEEIDNIVLVDGKVSAHEINRIVQKWGKISAYKAVRSRQNLPLNPARAIVNDALTDHTKEVIEAIYQERKRLENFAVVHGHGFNFIANASDSTLRAFEKKVLALR